MPYRPDIERILPLLACPMTGEKLVRNGNELVAEGSGRRYPIVDGVPVLWDGAPRIETRRDADSNGLPVEVQERFESLEGWGLNVGAGGTERKFSNCIELETAIWRHTDIVGDTHRLPFASSSFSYVVSLNTFEHLMNPSHAASEILRVLEPGGEVYILAPFLVPLHEAPHHYYNCTEFGLRQWFSAFDIKECKVSGNFNPIMALSWIANEIFMDFGTALGPAEAKRFAGATCEDIRRFWAEPSARGGELWNAFYSLPQDLQKKYSAGFELHASKPVESGAPRPSTPSFGPSGYASRPDRKSELMGVPARELVAILWAKARRRLLGSRP